MKQSTLSFFPRRIPSSTTKFSQHKEVFSAKDLMFCHCQAQMVLLPHHFLLLVVLRCNKQSGTSQRSWDFFLSLNQKPCSTCGVKNSQLSLFTGPLVLQPEVVVDRKWRSNKSCQRTFPTHLFDPFTREPQHRRCFSLKRVRKFFHIQCPTVSSACLCLPEIWSHLY